MSDDKLCLEIQTLCTVVDSFFHYTRNYDLLLHKLVAVGTHRKFNMEPQRITVDKRHAKNNTAVH